MYVEIKENKLLSWCEMPYSNYEYVNIDYSTFDPIEYIIVNNQLIKDLTNPVYIQEQKNKKIFEIKQELSELDTKRIRAIAEPSLKNEETGETWLEYYNSEILDLRNELEGLK